MCSSRYATAFRSCSFASFTRSSSTPCSARASGSATPSLSLRPRTSSGLRVPTAAPEPKRLRPKRAPSSSAQSTSRRVTGRFWGASTRKTSRAAMTLRAPSSQPPFGTESMWPPSSTASSESPGAVAQRLPASSVSTSQSISWSFSRSQSRAFAHSPVQATLRAPSGPPVRLASSFNSSTARREFTCSTDSIPSPHLLSRPDPGERLFEDVRRFLGGLARNAQGWRDADGVSLDTALPDEQALLPASLQEASRRLRVRLLARPHDLQAEHKATPPHLADGRALLGHLQQPVLEVAPDLGSVLLQVVVQDVLQAGQGAGGREVVAAEGREVEVRRDGLDNLRPPHHRADREPVTQALRPCNEVRFDAVSLYAPEVVSGPPKGGLDFVGDQEYPRLVQDLLYPLEVARRRLYKPADPLYRLRDERGHMTRGLRLDESPQVIRAEQVAPRLVPAERAAVLVGVRQVLNVERGVARGAPGALAGDSHRREGSAVVGGAQGHYLARPTVPGREE